MEEETIAAKARKAVDLFKLLLDIVPRTSGSDPDAIEFEDQLGRFNIWCTNIGVFAEQHASLDYRLRDSLQATTLMKDLIDGLQRYLHRGAFISSQA
jgi:hypothetical protein